MDTKEKIAKAYHQYLFYTRDFLDESKEEIGPTVKKAMEYASEKTEELGEITREETEILSTYVSRDIKDAAEFIVEGERSLADWLRTDIMYIEDKFLALFSDVVTDMSAELRDMAGYANAHREWHTGEINGLGTLECKNCGEKIHFKQPGHIPPCPKCNESVFVRESL